jgi:hypothetical protein
LNVLVFNHFLDSSRRNRSCFDPAASYPKRSNHGLPSLQCCYCGALFWHSGRVGGLRGGRSIIYNGCCKGGKVCVPPYRPRPEPLASLAGSADGRSANFFIKSIRQYNCLFAFTSMGAHRSVSDGRGPSLFKIHGQVYHRVGSLLPADDGPPNFLQLYIYDTTNEIRNRLRCLGPDDGPHGTLEPSIVAALMKMLDENNPFAKKLRTARERLRDYPEEEFIIRIVGAREDDPIQYNLPTTDDLAMLVVGDFSLDTFKRDIVQKRRTLQQQQ